MPIAGGILVAGSAARCLSSAAGMLRFLARLSGRRRHVRRSCGPGGGCCATVQSFETTTTAAAGSSGSVDSASEVVAGTTTTTTTTTTAMSSVHHHQNRRRDWEKNSSGTFQDPRWIEDTYVPNRVGSPEYERLFATSEDERQTRTQSRQVRQLRQERSRAMSSIASMDHQIREGGQDCSRLSSDCDENVQQEFLATRNNSERLSPDYDREDQQAFFSSRKNGDRLSLDDFAECKLHRVEEIRDNQRLSRRQRLHRTSRCCGSTTSTESASTGCAEPSITAPRSEWGTSPDYVDLIVRGHHHHVDDDRERGTARNQRDTPATAFSGSSGRRRSRFPPYLATLLIISYTLFGIADACSSRSTPKPRPPTPTPRPNITFHMYTCPPDYAEWYCLNGATCFTVKIQESLLYNCLCANGFIGQRCEFKDLDGSYLPSRQRVMLETASIAGGATIAVFLVVIICIAAYIHCKRKQKEIRTSSTCVDTVDGPGRDPELRPFSNRSRSLMIFMAKNPNGSTMCPSIEQTRMPGWNDYSQMESARMASVNEAKRGSSH